MTALSVRGVTKRFGNFYAVRDLSFDVQQGQIFGLLGPNGAGKTTTIRMIMDIIMPDSGEIEVLGRQRDPGILDRVGYLPEERGLYRKMKVWDILAFFGELKGLSHSEMPSRITYWLERMDLLDWQEKKVEELSRGMQQKLQLVIALLHDPDLIILDEPFSGLDPVNTNLVKEILLEQKRRGKTVILSTHLMEQVEKICDAICLINKGQKVLGGDLAAIKRRYGRNHVIIEYRGDDEFLEDSRLIEKFDNYGNYVEIRLREGADPQILLRKALEQAEISRFEIVEPSLNEIFIETVKEA